MRKIKKVLKMIILSVIILVVVPIVGGVMLIFIDTFTHSPTPTPSQNTTSTAETYIDLAKSDELNVYDEDTDTTKITLSYHDYNQLLNYLDTEDYSFDMAKYYGLENNIALYNATIVQKDTQSDLLDGNGKLDLDKLLEQVRVNNAASMSEGKNVINSFYTELSTADMTKICKLIVEVVNAKFNNIDIDKVANTLTQLTMFERTGSASNAYVTNDLTFVYNPTMTGLYGDMKEIAGTIENKEDIATSVIIHEIMHLLEYAVSDNNSENGIEAGFCRMYNVPELEPKTSVDSLWYTWLLEAGAELGMSEYMNIEPGTYAKKISYVRSYNLSRFNDLNLATQGLEDVVFYDSLEDVYSTLGLSNEKAQRDFLNFMYSIEITQSDPEDFWMNYTSLTKEAPSDSKKTALRMEIRTEAVKYLTKNFYKNLIDAVYERRVSDLDTLFYLIRTWELDAYGHLEYSKVDSLPYASDFIEYQEMIHIQLFQAIANSNLLTFEGVKEMYAEYNLQVKINDQVYDNCDLRNYNQYTSTYITSAKDNYLTTYFCRNRDVYEKM